jgi:hypothetical protein
MKKILVILLCLLPALAHGDVVLDANHFVWTRDDPVLSLGGEAGKMYAQTFEAKNSAPLVRVELVIDCSASGSGMVTVEIQKVGADGMPNGAVLGGVGIDSHEMLGYPITISEFPIAGVGLIAGADYAIVIRGDPNVDCGMREGGAPMGFTYRDGEAFVSKPSARPDWQAVDFTHGTNDLAFWVYVEINEPAEPRFCEVETFTNVPASWRLADVPLCGCVRDNILLNNSCWFAFPEWTLWRQIPLPFEQPAGKADWWVVPLNSNFPGLFILESDLDGYEFSTPVKFAPGLKPGKMHQSKARYKGQPKGTLVDIEFEIDGEPAHIQFETLIDIPQQ